MVDPLHFEATVQSVRSPSFGFMIWLRRRTAAIGVGMINLEEQTVAANDLVYHSPLASPSIDYGKEQNASKKSPHGAPRNKVALRPLVAFAP